MLRYSSLHFLDDTSQVDIPDTPAPVFAARAIRRAVFGTPAQVGDDRNTMNAGNDANSASEAADTELDAAANRSPSKPSGILLTPGTGTSRRKTVTFRHDVKPKNSSENVVASGGAKPRPRTPRLTQAMERSKRTRHKKPEVQDPPSNDEDSDWVEEEEGDYICSHDHTVDLNEPHSRSGKYWKASFEKYHGEARIEMEKLVKYKQLAKSYAKMKDAEAEELKLKLREEQEKVTKMEKEVAEQASKLATRMVKGEKENPELMRGLAKQTAIAVQYREQVKELEAMLKERDDDDGEGVKDRRNGHHATSPRTQKTLLETQRELRRARAQSRELGDVKDRLERVEARAKRLGEENKRLRDSATSTRELERHIRSLEADIDRKQEESMKLQEEYDSLKENAKARHSEATWVVQQRDEKISELRKEVRSLKATSLDSGRTQKKLNEALLTDSTRIMAELKHEIDLLAGSRKRSLGKKVDALAANMQSLGYELSDIWGCTEMKDLAVPLGLSAGQASGPEQAQEPVETNILDENTMPLPEDQDGGASRTVRLAATSVGTRVVSSRPRPKSMMESIHHSAPAHGSILSDRVNKEKLDALKDRRERRSREFVPCDTKPTIASLVTGAANLEAPKITMDADANPRKKHDQPISLTPLRLKSTTSGAVAAASTAIAADMFVAGLSKSEPQSPVEETPKFDIVADRYARVGAAHNANGSALWSNASKSSLPPDRLSAAVARIEQRKMERRRAHGRVLDKENVQP